MGSLRVLNFSGANITVPYKEKAAQIMDVLSEGAKIIGCINTIVCKKGKLTGKKRNPFQLPTDRFDLYTAILGSAFCGIVFRNRLGRTIALWRHADGINTSML